MNYFSKVLIALRIALLFTISTFCMDNWLLGQATNFVREYGFSTQLYENSRLSGMAILPTGEVALTGNFTQYSSVQHVTQPFLVLTDPEGNPIWTKTIQPRLDTAAIWDVTPGNDGTIVMAGRRNDTTFISKVGLNGQVVWATGIKHGNWRYRSYAKVIAGNDGYYLIGTKTDWQTQQEASRLVIRIREDGSFGWLKAYKASGGSFLAFESMSVGAGGNLCIYADGSIYGPLPNTYIGHPLVFLDSSGNVLSARGLYSSNYGEGGGGEVITCMNGDFARVDRIDIETFRLTRVDPNGGILWSKLINAPNSGNFEFTENASGDFAIVTYAPLHSQSQLGSVLTIFLDPSGNFLHSQSLNLINDWGLVVTELLHGDNCEFYLAGQDFRLGRSDSTMSFAAGQPFSSVSVQNSLLSDSQIVILPDTISYSTSTFDLSLTPLNLVFDSTLVSSPQVACLSTQVAPSIDPEHVTFAPNPFSDEIKVTVPAGKKITMVEVYDLQGRLKAESSASGEEILLSTSVLEPGVYILSVRIGDRRVCRKAIKY